MITRLAVALLFLTSGALGVVDEVLWARLLGLYLGHAATAHATVVATFLLGLGVGYAWLGRQADGLARPLRRYAMLEMGVGVWCLVFPYAADLAADLTGGTAGRVLLVAAALLLLVSPAPERLPWWLARLRFAVRPQHFASWQVVRLGLIAGVIMVPAVAMGVLLPLCGRLAMRRGHVAGAAADVFAWNTVGSVAVAALGGTLLVAAVGLHGALLVAVAVLLLAALIALIRQRGAAIATRRGLAVALLLAGWTALDPGPWDVRLLSAGAFRRKVHVVPSWAKWRARLLRETVVFSADGPDATVAVLARDGGRVLKVNGKPDASSRGDMLTQVASAWVPAVLAKRADRILVIGLGSGVTAGAAARLSRHVEVVEIAPAVVAAARHFARWNHDVVDNPAVAIHVADARAWLARTDRRWDVIISEPSNPWVAGNGALVHPRVLSTRASPPRPRRGHGAVVSRLRNGRLAAAFGLTNGGR